MNDHGLRLNDLERSYKGFEKDLFHAKLEVGLILLVFALTIMGYGILEMIGNSKPVEPESMFVIERRVRGHVLDVSRPIRLGEVVDTYACEEIRVLRKED